MVNQSLGLIEVVGLAAALEAADAALKAANIELLGYELTKGGGLVLVKLCGDVGAVTAGVQAGKMAASKVSKVWSTHVIPRPHEQLSCIVVQDKKLKKQDEPLETTITVSQVIEEEDMIEETSEPAEMTVDAVAEIENLVVEEEVMPEAQDQEIFTSEENHENLADDDDNSIENIEKKRVEDICNLCNDPACHRKKGDPKITCIYYLKND